MHGKAYAHAARLRNIPRSLALAILTSLRARKKENTRHSQGESRELRIPTHRALFSEWSQFYRLEMFRLDGITRIPQKTESSRQTHDRNQFHRVSDAVVFEDFASSRSYVLLDPSSIMIEDVDSPMIADHHSPRIGGDLALQSGIGRCHDGFELLAAIRRQSWVLSQDFSNHR